MNQAQQLFGEPLQRARDKVKPYMADWICAFIRQSPFLVMATSCIDGDCDATPKGGKPGFVKVLDDRHLLIPDVAGNKLFQSYENLESNAKVGLIFFIPGINATARINGRASVLRPGDPLFDRLHLEIFQPDERAKILQALRVEVDESYSHCPRSLTFSDLWNTGTIESNVRQSPIPKWSPGT